MKQVRTRFAPSPTGMLHVGGVRTALYAYLFARKQGGKFLLRIEDTDQERSVPGAIKYIIEMLNWFGIEIDEGPSRKELAAVNEDWPEAPALGGTSGPYIQSLRRNRYKEVADLLVEKGVAFRCDCTPEMLEEERQNQTARKEVPGYGGRCRTRNVPADVPHVVRFRMPEGRGVTLDDSVKGKVTWEDIPLRDPILMKTDGFPTYHLAVVVDDHDMEITHVQRGEEWLSSAPLHLFLYEALGWEAPNFAHLPVILGKDGKKLSKRDGATFAHMFRDDGYLPEALLNYVALVGWSPGEGVEQEIFSLKELEQIFSIERVNKASGTFDYEKLLWMNGMHVRALKPEALYDRVKPFFEAAGLHLEDEPLRKIFPHAQERLKVLKDLPPMVDFLFLDKIERDIPAMLQKGMDAPKAIEILGKVRERLSTIADFEVSTIDSNMRALASDLGLKPGVVFVIVRIAVTGKTTTPPLFESLSALGKEKTLARLDECRAILEQRT